MEDLTIVFLTILLVCVIGFTLFMFASLLYNILRDTI